MNQRSAEFLRRAAAIVVLGLAFLFMGSVFAPDRTTAGERAELGAAGTAPLVRRSPAEAGVTETAGASVDPHEGLRALGSLESGRYLIDIYATPQGPRYSVYERSAEADRTAAQPKLIGALLRADQVRGLVPEIQLESMDFSAPAGGPTQIMTADEHAIGDWFE